MFKCLTIIVLFCIIGGTVLSQDKVQIDLKKQRSLVKKNREFVQNDQDGFIIKKEISVIELIEKETKEGFYRQLFSEGMSKTFDAGKPDLPVINRLIEIPQNHTVALKFISYDEEIINLKDYGLTKLISPAQPSFEKSKSPKDIPFYKDDEVYSANEFYSKETVKLEDIGYLRDKHLGYIEISPFSYNPVTNTLKVLNNIEVSVEFIPERQKRYKTTEQLASPYFNNINYQTINKTTESKSLISGPVKYVIVSDRMFEETLQPFIEWKTQKGFIVVEAYTDVIGNTTTDIQAYLQDLYDNPSDGISPTFGLLVGDVDQVPTFSGTAGSHKTDLYYFEYTGDKLPEVFYGRFSAESVEELQPQIDKTLEVEKYEMPDPSYLDNVVLVAGVDGSYAPTYGNGAINYANSYYTNSDNDITSYYYLYNDDSGVMSSNNSGASASIRNYISQGVSFSNYTAHCGSSGWSDPSFSISHIDGLTNEHMYPLMIGNCCQSNTFVNDDCFGEEILMAANKGAVGYIGGSNLTYWDEDYYWAIGLTGSITANPTYEGSELGAYDRFFHLNGEAKEDWYITQGQISVAGNIAVEASTSSRKAYYWEIYHLMGDPSLTPYITVPESMVATYGSEISIGSSSFQVTAEENSYVALSQNGVLLDAQLADALGSVNLSFGALSEVGTADIVITKQNRQPIIDEINVIPATIPYVVLDNYNIDDSEENNNSIAENGETISLDIQFINQSDLFDAFNVTAYLTSSDTNVIITDNTEILGNILKSDSTFIDSVFSIQLKEKIEDQHVVTFDVEINGEDSGTESYTWSSTINMVVNAPKLQIDELIIDDSSENDNGNFDPGETVDISLVVSNSGNSEIKNLNGIVTILGGGENYLTFNNSESGSFDLSVGQADTLKFNATAESDVTNGTLLYINFEIGDPTYSYYGISQNYEIIIGEIPDILISDEDTSVANIGYFYDTGGESGNYSNNENHTITLTPEDADKFLKAEFISFSVERDGNECYDYLKVYDALSTDADSLIGTYCDSNVPEVITATNEKGALTFSFYSDVSIDQSGWKAEIRSYVGYSLEATVNGPEGLIDGATVEIDGKTAMTDENGIANIYNIAEGVNIPIKIYAENHDILNTDVNILENSAAQFNLDHMKYDVTFNLSDDEEAVDGDVTFDEKTLTTESGSVIFENVSYGLNKEFVIVSTGCEDSVGSVDITSDTTLNIELKPIEYDIEFIISDGIDPVQDALIEFDDKEVLTSIDGIALFEDVRGEATLNYIIRKSGFNNLEGSIEMMKDSTVNLTLTPGTAEYKVTFTVENSSNPVYNAEVVLNNDTIYTDVSGQAIFNNILEETGIPYRISKEHYKDISGTINVNGVNVYVDTLLDYKSYEITFNITDGTNPIEGATISFDGKSGDTDENGQCIMDVTYSLNKQYSITKTGYADTSGVINVDDDKVVDVAMRQFKYNVTFVVKAPNANALEGVLAEFNGSSQYTDEQGEALFRQIAPGNNISFKLSIDEYFDYDSVLNVVDQDVVFYARMSSTTGITEVNKQNIKIYPNPSNGQFTIEISDLVDENCTIKIFNVIGSNVYTKEFSGKSLIKEVIDITQYAKGMYFVSVETDNGSILSKRMLVK